MSLQKNLRQLGQNLKTARVDCGLRQIDVEALVGLNYRHYQDIEAGKVNVTVDTLFRLAKVYGIRVADLVENTGSSRPRQRKG